MSLKVITYLLIIKILLIIIINFTNFYILENIYKTASVLHKNMEKFAVILQKCKTIARRLMPIGQT